MIILKPSKSKAILEGISSILEGKQLLFKALFSGSIIAVCLFGVFIPQTTIADRENVDYAAYVAKSNNEAKKVVKTIKAVLTAYSSTPDQTDDTPFITASGKHVADGIVANNLLPFGTKIRIPALYGDKVFVVQDRMHSRKDKNHVDVWMPTRSVAVNFGVKTAEIEVLKD